MRRGRVGSVGRGQYGIRHGQAPLLGGHLNGRLGPLTIPYLLPEVFNDDVSQTEYDDYRTAHGLRWQSVKLAIPEELTRLRAERCE